MNKIISILGLHKTRCYPNEIWMSIGLWLENSNIRSLSFYVSLISFSILFTSIFVLCLSKFSIFTCIISSFIIMVSNTFFLISLMVWIYTIDDKYFHFFHMSLPKEYKAKHKVITYDEIMGNPSVLQVKLDGVDDCIYVNKTIFLKALNQGYVSICGNVRQNIFRKLLIINEWIPVYKKPLPRKKLASSQLFLYLKFILTIMLYIFYKAFNLNNRKGFEP